METDGRERHTGSGRDRDLGLQARPLQGEPTAPSDLVVEYLAPLVEALHRGFPRIHDDALLEEAASDLLFKLGEHPEQYDPERRSLRGYLLMAARRDVL